MRDFESAQGRLSSVCRILFCAAIGATVSLPLADAQSTSTSIPPGIVATGAAEIRLQPETLRLSLKVKAQGKDARSAIKSLTDHKDRVRSALIEMNADPDSIQFASTRLSSGGSDSEQRQAMQMMRMMQRQMGGASIDMDAIPTIYTATSTLRVEWPLPTQDPDALALLPQGLKDQVERRDLAGKENKPDLSEEQLEKLEAMQSSMEDDYGYSMSMSSGESSGPTVVFVGRPTKEQREDVLKQAFSEARQSAELTAKALGTAVRALKSAWPRGGSSRIAALASYEYYGYSEDTSDFDDDGDDVVTAATADGLRLRSSVMAVYDFAQP